VQLAAYHEISVFETLKPEWNTLLHRSTSDCIFSTWEWQSTWWEAYHSGLLWVITCREDNGQLIGIAPWFVQTTSEGERVIRSIGCVDVTDYVDVIAEPERLSDVLEAFAAHLVEQRTLFDRINLCNIPEKSPTLQVFPDILRQFGLDAELVFQEVCPVIELPDEWEKYLEALDKKQRHEIRRKIRRAEAEAGQLEWYIVGSNHELAHELECFLSLMASSHPEKATFLRNPQNLAFFRKITPLAYEKGWLQLAFLVINGENSAAYLNFDYNGCILVYNSGLLPEYNAHLSPGNVLLAYLIENAIINRRTVFDFLRGNEVYKYRMGAKDTQVFKLKAQLAS